MDGSWAAISITLPREERMHVLSREEHKWVFDVETRLKLIDSTLPGLCEMNESRKLEIAAGYCTYLEHCLTAEFNCRKLFHQFMRPEPRNDGATETTSPNTLPPQAGPFPESPCSGQAFLLLLNELSLNLR